MQVWNQAANQEEEAVEHLQHFGLRQDPYQNEPDLRFYFEGVSHISARRRIERGLRQHKGLCILSGEGGTGKSLLTRRLLDSLEEEVFDAQLMLMMPGATDASSVLGRYARMVGVEETDSDRPTLLAQIYEQLAIVREEGRHSVLMLDDAHLLSKDALGEIGGLLNLEYEDRRLMSLLLVGLPQLDVTLSHEASLGQRIDVRTRLEPFDFQNTSEYLKHRLATAGGDPEILPEEAVAALFKYGRGRPRLLNTVADNALFEAYLANRPQMNAHDVERAASELGIGAEPGSTYQDLPQPAGHSGSSLPGAPGSTFELHEVAEPEFEASSFETDTAPPPTAAPHQDVAMENAISNEEAVDSLMSAEPEPEMMAALEAEPEVASPTPGAAMEATLEPAPLAEPAFEADELSGDDLSTGDLSTDDLSTGDLSSGELSTDGLPTGALSTNGLSTQDLTADSLPADSFSTDLSSDALASPALGTPIDDLDSAVEEMLNSSSGFEDADDAPSPFDLTADATNPTEPLALEGELEGEVPAPHEEGDVDDLFAELIEE